MRFYEDPQKTSENRLPQRAYYIPEGEGAYTLLNGQWRFRYYARDIDLEETIKVWDTTPVPSCWQSRGYENPNYTNVKYPFPVDLPYVPDDNPCAVYEREFTVENPKYWNSEEPYLYTLRLEAAGEYVPYLKPQEHGNHYGVRLLAFEGLRFEADQPFDCRVSQYSAHELFKKRHAADLQKDGVTHVRIDYKHSGVGSGSCGPLLAEQYRLSEKHIQFRFRMEKVWN